MKSKGIFILFSSLFIILFSACNGGWKTDKESGLEYKFHQRSGSGKKAKFAMVAVYHFTARSDRDSIFMSSYTNIDPVSTEIPEDLRNQDMVRGLLMMEEGDSASFRLLADSFYLRRNVEMRHPAMEGSKYITFTIRLFKVLPFEEFEAWDNQRQLQRFETEIAAMKEWAQKNKLEFQTDTLSGIKYHYSNPSNGPKIKEGQRIRFHLKGSLASGYVFLDTRANSQPLEFEAGKWAIGPEALNIIPGLLSEGQGGTFLVPFERGYGKQAKYGIPPYSFLIYEIDKVELIK